jgi:hypothetical protein
VANALPGLKAEVDIVTRGPAGAGVVELIDQLLADDLAELESRLVRHHILVGTRADGAEVRLRPYGVNLLITGTSGGGKSELTTGLLERLAEKDYQFCVIDPEGDYEMFEQAAVIGSSQHPPAVAEVSHFLRNSRQNLVINLVGLRISERPPFFLSLLPQLQELRARTGRPHWVVADESHHLMPAHWEAPGADLLAQMDATVRVTPQPRLLSPAALATVDTVIAVGESAEVSLQEFSDLVHVPPPRSVALPAQAGWALLWCRNSVGKPVCMRPAPGRTQRQRHRRKYAEGELPADRSFYFRGPDGKLNLRAQNLMLFMQLADGLDAVTWLYHLRRGDYARWFRDDIKDENLAAEAEGVAERTALSAAQSRKAIRALIERRYTLPGAAPLPVPGTDAAPRQR